MPFGCRRHLVRLAGEMLRFGLVGIAATAAYFMTSLTLVYAGFRIDPTTASVGAFALSILVSYFGHNHFSFRVGGRHMVYLPRFLSVSLILMCLSSGATYALDRFAGMPAYAITTAITVSYPVLSFILSRWVTFRQ